MKKMFFLMTIVCLFCSSCGREEVILEEIETASTMAETSYMSESETEIESYSLQENEMIEETIFVELTEEEYKDICREVYYDDIFSNDLSLGEKVKIYSFVAEKYKYFAKDVVGMVVEDIEEQYNLSNEYIGACVMHEETKEDIKPSYFGKQFYLMFSSDSEIKVEDYNTGSYIVVYGEVVKTNNGIFILPKYIEQEQ